MAGEAYLRWPLLGIKAGKLGGGDFSDSKNHLINMYLDAEIFFAAS